MPLYYRDEWLWPAGAGAFALSAAVDRSSCPDAAPFYQQVISLADRSTRPLGDLALPRSAAVIAGAARAPIAAIASAPRSEPALVRVLDLARGVVVSEHPAPGPFHRIALDATGTRLAYLLQDRVVFTEVADGRETGAFPLGSAQRFRGHVAHCRDRWVVAVERGRKWLMVVLTDEGAPTGRELPLRGEPFELSGAGDAPVVACGIGKKLVQVVDVETGASVAVTAHTATDAYAAVRTCISDDGTRVLSRGTSDERLCVLVRGAAVAVEVARLPRSTTTVNGSEFSSQPAFAMCGETLVTVRDGLATFVPSPGGAPVSDVWGRATGKEVVRPKMV
jgi:hypothetical protein